MQCMKMYERRYSDMDVVDNDMNCIHSFSTTTTTTTESFITKCVEYDCQIRSKTESPIFCLKNTVLPLSLRKKSKFSMLCQQVATPLKENDPVQLRTVNKVLQDLGKEDLQVINQILGTAGAQLGQNGVVTATVGPTQSQQRIRPPRVPNEQPQRQQQQQQIVMGQMDLVPQNQQQVQVGADQQQVGGNARRVCANVVGNNLVCANVVGNESGAAGGNGAPAMMNSLVLMCFYFVFLFLFSFCFLLFVFLSGAFMLPNESTFILFFDIKSFFSFWFICVKKKKKIYIGAETKYSD